MGSKVFENKGLLNVKNFNKGKYRPCSTGSIILWRNQIKTCSTLKVPLTKTPSQSDKQLRNVSECYLSKNHNMLENPNTA